jgi:hypothetical protein
VVTAQLSEICIHSDYNIELVAQHAVVQNEERTRILNAKRAECRRQRDGRRAGINGVGSVGQDFAFNEPL